MFNGYNGKGCSPLGIVTWLHNPIASQHVQVRHVAQAIIDDMDDYAASQVHGQDDILDMPTDLVYIGHHYDERSAVSEWTFGSNYEDGTDVLVFQHPILGGDDRWVIRSTSPNIFSDSNDRAISFGQAMKIAVNFHVVFVANGYLS